MLSPIQTLPGFYLDEDDENYYNSLYQLYLRKVLNTLPEAGPVENKDDLIPVEGVAGASVIPVEGIPGAFVQKSAPAPAPKPQGLRSLLEPYNLSSNDYRIFTQSRAPTNSEKIGGESGGPTKDLYEQYADLGRPSFLGFTGDLGAKTGRTIRVDSNRGDDVIRRAETYRDVLNAYQRYKSSQGA
jgi:hypothetical protein